MQATAKGKSKTSERCATVEALLIAGASRDTREEIAEIMEFRLIAARFYGEYAARLERLSRRIGVTFCDEDCLRCSHNG
jgi:hypothetical protein